MRNALWSVILLSLVVVVGCGPASINAHPRKTETPLYERTAPNSLPSVGMVNPTSVEISRPKHGKLHVLDMTLDSPSTARKLYSDLKSLHLFPKGTMNCPADFGVDYTLTFRNGKKVVLVANADPDGCQAIKLSTGQTLWGVEQVGKPFWTDLAKAIGLPNDSYLGGPQ